MLTHHSGVDGLFFTFHFSESFVIVLSWKFTSKDFSMARVGFNSTGKYQWI